MKNIVFIIIFLLIAESSYAQKVLVNVEKVACHEDFQGFYLKITLKKRGKIWVRETKDYHMKSLLDEELTNEDRFEVMRALIPCFNDYSQSCNKVERYYIDSFQIEYPGMPVPNSKSYNIAIDAMFALNRLFYPSYLHRISTYPVLFDSKTLKEVNNEPKFIKQMADKYLEWFKLKQDSTFLKDSFMPIDDLKFLNQGTVKWWDMMLVEKGERESI